MYFQSEMIIDRLNDKKKERGKERKKRKPWSRLNDYCACANISNTLTEIALQCVHASIIFLKQPLSSACSRCASRQSSHADRCCHLAGRRYFLSSATTRRICLALSCERRDNGTSVTKRGARTHSRTRSVVDEPVDVPAMSRRARQRKP
jgi:hypothetical protein